MAEYCVISSKLSFLMKPRDKGFVFLKQTETELKEIPCKIKMSEW